MKLRYWPRIAAVVSALLAVTSLWSDVTAQEPPVAQTKAVSTVHDWDFLCGSWSVQNRLLRGRLMHSKEWVEFAANDEFHALPGGLGTEENYSTNHWPGYFAIGLHLFEPASKRWTLYWADNRNAPGTMQTLASGTFSGDGGKFYAPDSLRGHPVTVRIIWKRIDDNHAHWEQALSADRGRTWETNWTMEFTRRSGAPCKPEQAVSSVAAH